VSGVYSTIDDDGNQQVSYEYSKFSNEERDNSQPEEEESKDCDDSSDSAPQVFETSDSLVIRKITIIKILKKITIIVKKVKIIHVKKPKFDKPEDKDDNAASSPPPSSGTSASPPPDSETPDDSSLPAVPDDQDSPEDGNFKSESDDDSVISEVKIKIIIRKEKHVFIFKIKKKENRETSGRSKTSNPLSQS